MGTKTSKNKTQNKSLAYFEVNKDNRFVRATVKNSRIEKHKMTVAIEGKKYYALSAYDIPEHLYGNILLMFVMKGKLYPLPKEAGEFKSEMARDYYSKDLDTESLIYDNDIIKKKLQVLEDKKEKLRSIINLYKDMATWEQENVNVIVNGHKENETKIHEYMENASVNITVKDLKNHDKPTPKLRGFQLTTLEDD